MVSIVAFQAIDPGSIPGQRILFFYPHKRYVMKTPSLRLILLATCFFLLHFVPMNGNNYDPVPSQGVSRYIPEFHLVQYYCLRQIHAVDR